MKKTINYLIMGWLPIVLLAACSKTETTTLPPREADPDVEVLADAYREVLIGSSEGWLLSYQPDQYDETIYFHLKFKDQDKLDITAGYRGYHTLQADIHYDFEGNYIPVIRFEGENVFHELAEKFNGSVKFKVFYDEGDETFEWVRADGFNNVRFPLTKVTTGTLEPFTEQLNAVLAQIAYEEEQERLSAEVRMKINAFAEIESPYYFYNFMTDQFAAAINSFDTVSRAITLTYKSQPTAAPTTITSNYSIYPDGLILNPAISFGSVLIDSVELGAFDDPVLQITRAGNAGEGQMGHMHVPPYAFTNTVDRNVSTVDWLLDPAQQHVTGSGTGLFMYTAHADNYYSPLLNDHRMSFAEYIDEQIDNARGSTRLVNQIYFPENPATSRNIQISTHRIAPAGNLFYLYRFDLEKQSGLPSALSVKLTEPASAIVPHQEAFDTYLRYQFPAQGVTVVPVIVGTTLRLRLVSREDSRYWVEYVLNRAANRSLRFD